jgi:hypothetical protein
MTGRTRRENQPLLVKSITIVSANLSEGEHGDITTDEYALVDELPSMDASGGLQHSPDRFQTINCYL